MLILHHPRAQSISTTCGALSMHTDGCTGSVSCGMPARLGRIHSRSCCHRFERLERGGAGSRERCHSGDNPRGLYWSWVSAPCASPLFLMLSCLLSNHRVASVSRAVRRLGEMNTRDSRILFCVVCVQLQCWSRSTLDFDCQNIEKLSHMEIAAFPPTKLS